MTQRHLDRLNPEDTSFLAVDRGTTYGNPGFLFTVDGQPPTQRELERHMGACVERMPRLRHRLQRTPLGLGRPWWVEDPSFQLDWHVRSLAIASEPELHAAVARIFSQRMDETKPLWELWLLSGYAPDRFTVAFKTHHCVGDGVSFGQHFTRVLLDAEDGAAPVSARSAAPAPTNVAPPSQLQLLREAWRRRVRAARGAAARVRGPSTALREHALALLELAFAWLRHPAPRLPSLNGPLSPHRQLLWRSRDLDEQLQVRSMLGGTLNDAFLTAFSSALRRWLAKHGLCPYAVLVGVPVNLRPPGEEARLGNEMTGMRLVLPLEPADPLARHREIVERTRRLKSSRQLAGAQLVTAFDWATPARALGGAMRFHTSTRFFNVFASNLPGPREPLFLLGRRVTHIHPCNILLTGQRVIVTLMSYAGTACLTVVADAGVDAAGLCDAIEEGFDELQAAARAQGASV
ncbi:MAG: wax ester/triacylglycerol synthase domain-containing protein, partial [Conexibacter sp.]